MTCRMFSSISGLSARGFIPLAVLALLLVAGTARSNETRQDFAILLADVDVRTEAGFGKPVIRREPYLSVFRVKGTALGEGRQPWYGIVLREERTPRRMTRRGWILKLPGESDPLLKDEVAVFRYPGDPDPPKLVRTKWLSRTGLARHDGAWSEVNWNVREDQVDELVGFVPASDVALDARTTREKVDEKVGIIRANPKWTPQMISTILRGEVREGYSREAVLLALGEPPLKAELGEHRERFVYRGSAMGSVEIHLLRGFVEKIRRIDPDGEH